MRSRRKALSVLRSLTAYHVRAGAIAAQRPIAQELLQTFSRIHLGCVNVAIGVEADLMQVMEIAGHSACASDTAKFLKVLAVEDIDGHIGVVADIEAALSLVGREVHGHGCARHFGLRISAFADEFLSEIAALAGFSARIAARLSQIGIKAVEHLDAVVAAVANIELAVIGNL